MKTPKGLLSFHNKPWIEEQLSRFASLGGRRVVIVVGDFAELYFQALPWLESSRETWIRHLGLNVACVFNPDTKPGPFSSLMVGARFLVKGDQLTSNASVFSGVFILPVDVPVPRGQVWLKLTELKAEGVKACMPIVRGRGGHPVLLSGSYLRDLMSLKVGDSQSRLDVQLHLLKTTELSRVPVEDENIALNLNTPEEWQQFINTH